MEPITIPPSPGSRHVPILLAAGGIVLALVLLFLGRQFLETDIVSVTNSPITFSTDKLLYRTASGSTIPVTITVNGITPGTPLVALRMTLDGLPSHVTINDRAISGTGSTVIGKANVQRYGDKAIILLSDIEVGQDGPFLTVPFNVTSDPNDDVTSVVQIWSDPTAGSALVSQIAINDGGNYLSRRIETGPFFRLSRVQPTPVCSPRPACLDTAPFCQMAEPAEGWCPTPTPTPSPTSTPTATSTPTPTAYCAADGEFCAVHMPCCSGQCGSGTGTTLQMICVPTPTPTATPIPTPSPTATPICLPNGIFCGADGTSDLSCCSGQCTASGSTMVCVPSPTPTATPTSTPTPTPSPSPTTAPIQCALPLRGDVNCDGRITIVDLVLLVDFLAGKASLSESQVRNANVAETDQGRTNLADAAAFADFLSGRSSTL